MALSKIDVANMLTGATPTANGGTGSTASTLPASLINNTSIGNVTSLPAAVDVGSIVLISTTNITTGVGTVDITSGIDSTYDNYLIILQGITNATDDAILEMQVYSSAGSPDTTSGAYRHAADGRRDNGDGRATNSNSSNTLRLGNQVNGNQSDEVLEGEIFIHNVNSTTKRQIINYHIGSLQSDSAICHITGSAQYTNSGVAITGVRFLMTAGNITGGKIKLYGIS